MAKNTEFEKWSGRIVSILLAALLFLYVSYENSRMISSYDPGGGASISTEETVTSVPIEINVDTNQYFVSGIPESASVTLKGPQAVITQFLATNELVTQTPDLNQLGVGNHEISLTVKYLPNRVEADIMPASIDITIERKVVREYNIGVLYDDNIFAEGANVGEPQLSQSTAVVSG
ncbi:MAG: CdaR family protein, partial [Atopococcus tabaci]|nr:CdaR family protein [Atopococcus tabaci]